MKIYRSNVAIRSLKRESVTLEGFAELQRQLEQNLPKVTQNAVLRRAGTHAMQPMLDRAIELAPERSGRTKATIRMTVKLLKATARLGGAIRVQIGAGDKHVFWPRFQERGTVKMPPHPFMRPAFDQEATSTLGRLKQYLALEIGKAVARRQRRLARKG